MDGVLYTVDLSTAHVRFRLICCYIYFVRCARFVYTINLLLPSNSRINGQSDGMKLEAMCHKQTDDGRVVYITCIPTTCCGEIF